MISEVSVRHFQSLHRVELELAPLTVIVGPSSSGKSAFTRALKTLTSNQRGNAFITHGEKICTITAKTDRGTVTLTRGKASSDNAYTVIPADDPTAQRTYTKLGGETPEEVSAFLGIPSREPINYAGQFDKPYLLDDSAGEVARVLGALTNVSVIFDGARESNRRKTNTAATLRTRAGDLEEIQGKIPQYRELKGQIAALDSAEQEITRAGQIQRRIAQLTEALEQSRIASATVTKLEPYLSAEIPDEQPIVQAAARLSKYRGALKETQAASTALTAATEALTAASEHEQSLAKEFTHTLEQLAGGFEKYFETHSKTINTTEDHTISVTEAAALSARYIAETLK